MTPRAVFTRSLLAAPLLALAACGGGGETVETTIPATADLVVKAVPTIRWDAAAYSAPAGEIEIFLANDDNVKHTLVVLQDDKVVSDFELVINKKGDTDSGTITLDPGQYYIYCTVPGHGSMKSTLTVS
jgi:plastocyanin